MTKGLDGKIVCEKHQWPTKDCVLCMSAVYEKEQVADLMQSRVGALEARIAELEKVAEAAVIVCQLVDEKSSMVYGLLERPLKAAGYLGVGDE
jgi:hypothetical protein